MGTEYGSAYQIFKLTTGTAVRYAALTGELPSRGDVQDLVDQLVEIAVVSHATVDQPEDLVQRFYLALANVLWAAHDQKLVDEPEKEPKARSQ